MDNTKLRSEKDRIEENKIPNARDKARKRKGKDIALINYGGLVSNWLWRSRQSRRM